MENERLKGDPKIAIVHDWLVTFGGAENLLLQMLECFPNADLYCSVENLPASIRNKFPKIIETTFIQNLPLSKKHYWYYAPIMPLAMEQLNLSKYDLVITSSHAFAKGVLIHPHQLHISYINSPPRFAWDLQFDYFENFGFKKGLKRIIASLMFYHIRNWDVRTANSIDKIIANSKYIQKRIQKCYRRESEVIYPGVNTDFFSINSGNRENFYLAGSFMNPFKRLDLVIQAFNEMPEKKLFVFGNGPQESYLRKIARPNITFLGKVTDSDLLCYLQKAKAFIFAATEDFGMIMAEAQACGTPVIAYQRGGASDIIINTLESKMPTGILFSELTPLAIIKSVGLFEINQQFFNPQNSRTNALRFDKNIFKAKFKASIELEWIKWLKEK